MCLDERCYTANNLEDTQVSIRSEDKMSNITHVLIYVQIISTLAATTMNGIRIVLFAKRNLRKHIKK